MEYWSRICSAFLQLKGQGDLPNKKHRSLPEPFEIWSYVYDAELEMSWESQFWEARWFSSAEKVWKYPVIWYYFEN